MNIRKDDNVQVLTGDDAGTTGRVLRILPLKGKVVVEGVNKVYKHVRPSRRNPQGGRLSKEMPIDISNIQLVCPTCRRGVRVGRRYNTEGRKERFCRRCGGQLGFLSKPRAAYSEKAENA
jgi:large subunit ribosomal protein L24